MSDLVNNILNNSEKISKNFNDINEDTQHIVDLIFNQHPSQQNKINKQKILNILLNEYEYYDDTETDIYGRDFIKYISKEVYDTNETKIIARNVSLLDTMFSEDFVAILIGDRE